MKTYNYDLAVVGCGIAGSMAAIAAARHGIKVLAIDEAGYPGGALTAMGTGPMMTFTLVKHRWYVDCRRKWLIGS